MMTISEVVGLCLGAGVIGWCIALAFYLFRRYAYIITG